MTARLNGNGNGAPKKEKAPSASEPTKSGGGKQKSSRSLGNEVIRMTWVPQLRVPDDQLSVQNKQHVTGTWSYSRGDHMITETSTRSCEPFKHTVQYTKRKWDTAFGNCLVLFGAILSRALLWPLITTSAGE
ncbi:hypothetical protein Tco_0137733 [Tanacetum coccineum]